MIEEFESTFFVYKIFRKTYPSVAVPIKEPEVTFNRRAGFDYAHLGKRGEMQFRKIDPLYLENISSNTPTESEVLEDDIFEYVLGKEKRI